jgi:hypothetical protein
MPKILNAFASTAVQSMGLIWSEVWRQIIGVVLLVAAVSLLSRWGIAGAAFGVLAAALTMTILLHSLLRTAAGLGLRDVLGPQVPSIICASGTAAVAVWVGRGLEAIEPAPAPWLMLAAQGSSAMAFAVGFVLLCRFSEVRSLVREVVLDLAPGLARTIKLPA